MKKILGISLISFLAISMPLFSAGFGVYGTGGGGKTDMMTILHDGDYRVIYSMRHVNYGGGLMIESGSKEDEGFHNRLSFGLEGASTYGGRFDYRRLMRIGITNTFAFGVANSDYVRFWIGPLIGVNILTGLHETTRNNVWSEFKKTSYLALLGGAVPSVQGYGLYYLFMDHVWRRTAGTFIPIGLALGVNIRLGESAAIMLEAGFRCGFYFLTKGGFNYEGYMNAGFIFGAI